MSCRGFDQLVLFEHALGRLDPDESRRVRLHLEHCADCRAVLAEMAPMAGMFAAARQQSQTDLNEDSARRILAVGRETLHTPAGPVPVVTALPAEPTLPAPAPASVPVPVPAPVLRTWTPPQPKQPKSADRPGGAPALRRRLWWMLGAAAAAGVAAAVTLSLWGSAPGDPWERIEQRLAADAPLRELREPLAAAAAAELAAEPPDLSAVADLEFAGWIAAHAVEPASQREDIRRLVRGLRKPAPAAAWSGMWETTAHAAPPPSNDPAVTAARRLLAEGRSDEAARRVQGVAGRAARLVRAAAHRRRAEPRWSEAAEELLAAARDEADPIARARLRAVAAVYLWEAGPAEPALRVMRQAAALDNPLWVRAAYWYRWGLANDHMAAWALLHVDDDARLRAELQTAAFAKLPAVAFREDFDGLDGVDEDEWFLSDQGRSAWRTADEGDGRVLRQTELADQPQELLSKRLRQHLGREGDYTVQLDFRFDETAADPRMDVCVCWTQNERGYRLAVRPGSVQFSKRRPRLPGEVDDDTHFVEYLFPAGQPVALTAPAAPGTWFTAKVRTESLSGRTRLSAKVWPAGSPEPRDWTLVQEDDGTASKYPPLTAGRIGLSASRARMSFDNVLISANP
jgi:hypothetical protein